MAAPTEELEQINEIGPVVAASVHGFFEVPENRRLIERLRSAGLKLEEERPAGGTQSRPLTGKTFVVTGTLTKYTRDEIQDRIKALGGKAASSVSKKTDYVVAGENAGSKLANAHKLGVAVLSEDEFDSMIREML